MSKRRRSAAEWHTLLTEFESSDQPVAEFCDDRNINQNYFMKRRGKWRKGLATPFVAAKISVNSTPITIQFQDVNIRCSAQTSPVWLANLVAALRR